MVQGLGKVPTAASREKTTYDPYVLPDFDTEFISQDDLDAFRQALSAPAAVSVTALNDWRPIHRSTLR